MRPLILLLTLLAAGCATVPPPATVESGECKLIDQPEEPICGQTASQQRWLDVNLTGYGTACHWERRQGEACKVPSDKAPMVTPAPKKPAPKKFMGWLREKAPK